MYKKKNLKRSSHQRIDRTESKDNLTSYILDLNEAKPELELNKKSKSIVIHPIQVDYDVTDDEQVEFTLRNERFQLSCKQPKDMVLLESSDDTTLAIIKNLDIDMQFYGFIFTAISKIDLLKEN